MAQVKKGRKQALKDISKECPLITTYSKYGETEVMSVTAHQLNTKKTRYLNKLLGL